MRQLTSHRVNELNDKLEILANDDYYAISVPGAENCSLTMKFQSGPIAEGANGITIEALLAIVEDRLKAFQSGPFSCRENALALTHLQESMHWLHARTRERVQRGVEGTLQK